MLAVVLVVLVIFLFLRNLPATIIPSVAVPLSLVGTFGVMYLLGFSLDNLTLMAMTIATGFMVDDAIVMIENITLFIEKGETPRRAALFWAREIAFTVMSMSVSLVAVFIPLLLMGGLVGRLFHEFALTLSTAILISLIISLTTTPMMCAALLRPETGRAHGRISRPIMMTTMAALLGALPLPLGHGVGSELRRGRWWEIYNDPQLNALEEQVEISNQNIIAAEANFHQAMALIRVARAAYFPLVTGGPSWSRFKRSENLGNANTNIAGASGTGSGGGGGIGTFPGATLSDYLLNFDATLELDIWGKVRRSVESSQASAQASAATLEGVTLSARPPWPRAISSYGPWMNRNAPGRYRRGLQKNPRH